MRTMTRLPAFLGLLLLGSCNSLEVLDLNNPGLDDLLNDPTRPKIATAAVGVLLGARRDMNEQNGYVSLLGIPGRESYNFDPADPRFVTEMMLGPLDGGSPAFGGNFWTQPYRNIRNASVLLAGVDKTTTLTDPEKEATRGFAKTMQALDFLRIINTRDVNGAPIDIAFDPVADPAPIVPKDQVFARIVQLLDEAQIHLQAGSAAFPFGLGSGFTGFDTPATFLLFNRALKARVDVYTGNFSDALTALGQSFLVADPAKLDLGVYHVFTTNSGDLTNELFDPDARAILAHPSLATDAQLTSSATRDLRFQRKVATLSAPKSTQGLSSDLQFIIYTNPSASIPIIRNEELILLRAEANLGLGDLTAALTDINFIRVNSGGLALYTGLITPTDVLNELLYNKRYSLLFEGGHRWIDLRRYNLLTTLPQDPTSGGPSLRFDRFPFPGFECDARPTPPTGCGTLAGF